MFKKAALLTCLISITAPASAEAGGWQKNEKTKKQVSGIEHSGTAPSGMPYRYFDDGSGRLGELWTINCRTDPFSDERRCGVIDLDGGLVFAVSTPGRLTGVCAVHHNHPRMSAMIRVDGDPPLSSQHGCFGSDVAQRVAQSKAVTVRWYKFPDNAPRDKKSVIKGLGEALDLSAHIYNRYK